MEEVLKIDESEILFSEINEEKVVDLAKNGDNRASEYLIRKYKRFVIVKARTYFLIGGDREDIIQEGMIGLFKAIRDYNVLKQASFKSFAELCIKRQMITAIKAATRQKHIPLNSYVSLNKPVYEDDSERSLMDLIGNYSNEDPSYLLINKEAKGNIEKSVEALLSSLEWEVLTYYLEGKTYQEIAFDMNKDVKAIDNALQRVKKKVEKSLVKE